MKKSVKFGIAAVGLYLLAKQAGKKQNQDCACTHPAPHPDTAYTPGINPKPQLEATHSLKGSLIG